jgi:hypothetical protein
LRSTLAFARHGKRVVWRGVDAVPRPASAMLQAGDGDLLDALLEEFATVFHESQAYHHNVACVIASVSMPGSAPSSFLPTATPTCRKMNSSTSVM